MEKFEEKFISKRMAKKTARKTIGFKEGHKINEGKKNARKLKSETIMEQVYRSYCEHLSLGFTKKSWHFDQFGITLTWETMEKYIAQEPHNFDPVKKEIAFAKGMHLWEKVLNDLADGTNTEANIAALQMLMRNKYGWDKEDPSGKENSRPIIKELAKRWRGQSS